MIIEYQLAIFASYYLVSRTCFFFGWLLAVDKDPDKRRINLVPLIWYLTPVVFELGLAFCVVALFMYYIENHT